MNSLHRPAAIKQVDGVWPSFVDLSVESGLGLDFDLHSYSTNRFVLRFNEKGSMKGSGVCGCPDLAELSNVAALSISWGFAFRM